MDVNIHAISDKNFSIDFKETAGCTRASIRIGDAEVTLYFHDGKINKALLDIDTAIRAFLDSRK